MKYNAMQVTFWFNEIDNFILEQEKELIVQSLVGDAYLFQEMDTVPGD